MSKKPLLEEKVVRTWAKYAGIQNESRGLITEIYGGDEGDESKSRRDYMKEDDDLESPIEEGGISESDLLAELESLLEADEDEDLGAEEEGLGAEEEDLGAEDEDLGAEDEDLGAEDEDLGAEDADLGAEEGAGLSNEEVEDALKAGLEAMATAIGDALGIKIDVRAGEPAEPEEEVEMGAEVEEFGPEGEEEMGVEMGAEEALMEDDDEGQKRRRGVDVSRTDEALNKVNREELVERVMKRVAKRLAKKKR